MAKKLAQALGCSITGVEEEGSGKEEGTKDCSLEGEEESPSFGAGVSIEFNN